MTPDNVTALATVQGGELAPLTAHQIQEQVNTIQFVMRQVMKKDVHYGVIPGTGDKAKPALLKPGAEKICLTFRLVARFHVEHTDLAEGHREYSVRCTLYAGGREQGEGIGVCSTMESKYRYRWDATGKPVPQNYWDDRDPAKLGGAQFTPRKKDGKWHIYQRVAYENPADYYNTAAKMAKKRAHIDAVLTTTAASDIFDQDIEEMIEGGVPVHVNEDTPGNRPGRQAVARTQVDGDDAKRAELIAGLEDVAVEGTARLLGEWQGLSEEDRVLVGAEFGRLKKLAKQAVQPE